MDMVGLMIFKAFFSLIVYLVIDGEQPPVQWTSMMAPNMLARTLMQLQSLLLLQQFVMCPSMSKVS